MQGSKREREGRVAMTYPVLHESRGELDVIDQVKLPKENWMSSTKDQVKDTREGETGPRPDHGHTLVKKKCTAQVDCQDISARLSVSISN